MSEPVVLILAPSNGLGGGIERFLRGVEAALRAAGASVRRVDLAGPETAGSGSRGSGSGSAGRGRAAKARFAAAALRAAGARPRPVAVLAAHPGLAPVAAAAAWRAGTPRCFAFFYGADIFRAGRVARLAMGRPAAGPRPLAISGFGSGAVAAAGCGLAAVIPPTLERDWARGLVAARLASSRTPLADGPGRAATVLTVARLDHWRGKGIDVLAEAMVGARRRAGPARLVVAGRGPAPSGLRSALASVADTDLVESPSDADLAALYASADLFVLATRTSVVPPRSGEGFGIVLVEAQAAGCPVVGPAYGGSRDAYREGVTGWTPADESAHALTATLAEALAERSALEKRRDEAARWAETFVAGEAYARLVRSVLIG